MGGRSLLEIERDFVEVNSASMSWFSVPGMWVLLAQLHRHSLGKCE